MCGFNSQSVEVEGFIKYLKVYVVMNPDISLLMDVVVIDIPDVWGMLLSRKWGATIGGQIQMGLSYVTIPQYVWTPFMFYREPAYPTHVVNPGLVLDYRTKEVEKPSPILPSQEICILKRPNHKANRKWKPTKEYKVGDVVLVDKNPIPVNIHGKVEEDYYYIAKLNNEL